MFDLYNISVATTSGSLKSSYFFGPESFLVKNNSQGTENTKLSLLRDVKCSI